MSLHESTADETDKIAAITRETTSKPQSEQSSWRALIAPWWQATLAILPIFLLTRFVLLLLTYFGGILFFLPNYSPTARSLHDILFTWNRWDAIRLATIASQGYTSLEYAAFFPLFPALSNALSTISGRDAMLCGMVLSNAAFLGVLIVLYRLVDTEFDSTIARRTTLYLAIFPTAFFFFAAYNESLFLLFMLLGVYTLRQGSWWLAGLFGAMATLTRSIGLLLLVVFFFEYLRQKFPQVQQIWQGKKLAQGIRLLLGLAPALFIPLALGIYAYGLYVRFGDPLAFSHAQVGWREGLTFPWVAPYLTLKFIFTAPLFSFYTPHNLIDLMSFLIFLTLMGLALFGPERFAGHQWTFVLFGLMALLYPLFFPGIPGPNPPPHPYDPLPSMQRFVLEIFAGFIVLARLGRFRWFHDGYLILALPLQAFLTLQFMTGHWTI